MSASRASPRVRSTSDQFQFETALPSRGTIAPNETLICTTKAGFGLTPYGPAVGAGLIFDQGEDAPNPGRLKIERAFLIVVTL